MQRSRQYRAAAACALTSKRTTSRAGEALGRDSYASPATSTIVPFLLYVESEFLLNRASHTNCYLLVGVCLRIMLKMGLHRDPSRSHPAISAFDGEMRRRAWCLAVQIDLLVSFQLGLPSMAASTESDALPPRNLLDEDFGEHDAELPPSRPPSDYTHMTYAICKSSICRVFGEVARQAHSLVAPTRAEVMRIDRRLEEAWACVPSFMKVRPLHTCIADLPSQVVQRFGIGALYQKARCVLHRQYLIEKDPRPEHEYSRRACVLGAYALLEYQSMLFEATRPGGLLSQNGWFVSSLAMHDFLLAAVIVYLVLQSDQYKEDGAGFNWLDDDTPLPSKQQLMDALLRSYRIWLDVAAETPEVKKAPEVLEIIFRRIARCGTNSQAPHSNSLPESNITMAGPVENIAPEGQLPSSLPTITKMEGHEDDSLL